MKKIVIALAVITIVSFAVLKGGLWYLTQEFVDNQIIKAKPFVDISYNEIDSSLTGSATVSKVKVFIPALDETLYIESIQFLTPDLQTLFTLDSQLNNKQLPESLSLLISGLQLDLNGNIMKLMDNPDVEPTQLEVFSTLACGETYRIGSSAMTQMGYDDLTSDIILRYQFDPRNKKVNYSIRDNIRDMTHITLSGDIHNVSDLNSFSDKSARLGKISLEFQDDSYIERKNRFCAKQSKQSVEDYIVDHTTKVKTYLLSYGVIPEEGLLNAYKTLLETSGTVLFEADLSNLTGTEEFKTFVPNDVIQFMRLKLFVNGERINEISVDIDKEKLIETATSDDIELETPDQVERKQAMIIKKYRPVSVANLKNFDGYRAKIETTKGKHYKGTIKTGNRQTLEVITRLRSGNISYHVPWNQIKKAEVFN